MSRILQSALVFAFLSVLYAQDGAAPAPQAAGLETPWSIAPVIQELGAHATRLSAALDRIDARSWVAKGASETYSEQLNSCKEQARALAGNAAALAKNPEQLAASLEVYFRLQALETMLGSVEEGLRKYQSPADAQSLFSLEAEAGSNRDRFQRYIVNLASDREQQLKVMDQEAQRCRALLTAPTSPAKSGKKK